MKWQKFGAKRVDISVKDLEALSDGEASAVVLAYTKTEKEKIM